MLLPWASGWARIASHVSLDLLFLSSLFAFSTKATPVILETLVCRVDIQKKYNPKNIPLVSLGQALWGLSPFRPSGLQSLLVGICLYEVCVPTGELDALSDLYLFLQWLGAEANGIVVAKLLVKYGHDILAVLPCFVWAQILYCAN